MADFTDDEILAAIGTGTPFTYQVVETLYGRQLKAKSPHIRARLRRMSKAGVVIRDGAYLVLGQETWRVADPGETNQSR